MTADIMSWLWGLADRDLCSLIGLGFIVTAAVSWYVQKESRKSDGLFDIANAIRERK